LNLALEYLSFAAGAGAIGAILLLLLGTQVLDWYWPVILFTVAFLSGAYRARHKLLSRYRLAQLVDSRLDLQDRLSTVVFFRQISAPPDVLTAVEKQAEARISGETVERAVPLNMPRHGYVCAGLVVAAGTLLAIRYGVLHTMDLAPPLAHFSFEPFQPQPKVLAATKKTVIQERWEQQLKQLGISPQELEQPDEKGMPPTQANVPATPEPGAPAAEEKGPKTGKAPQSSPETGENSQGNDKTKGDQAAENASNDSDSQNKGQQQKGQTPPQNAKAGQQGSQENLMNKMRDALANLMNKLKSSSSQQDQQNASNNDSQQQGGKQQAGQQGMQNQGRQQGEGNPQDQQGNEQQASDKMPGDKSRGGEKASDRPASQDAKSGMGQQDGEKALREAQQLAAMGKISEIFGKRAQQLTGEMTVEVSSGKQQLKTSWSERKALHADTGAEVNRDEIPLAYQSYIQRYFEEIRKTPGAKPRQNPTP